MRTAEYRTRYGREMLHASCRAGRSAVATTLLGSRDASASRDSRVCGALRACNLTVFSHGALLSWCCGTTRPYKRGVITRCQRHRRPLHTITIVGQQLNIASTLLSVPRAIVVEWAHLRIITAVIDALLRAHPSCMVASTPSRHAFPPCHHAGIPGGTCR